MRPASSPLMACPDKLQSATSASFFRSLFPTHFTDCFLPRFSQVSFHIMLEILHDWRVNVTPAKTCSTIKRLEKIPKTLIFIAMEKVATLCGGRSDKDRNGNHIWKGEWQSRSQRANVHSYSDHNEAVPVPAPSLQIALDVCKSYSSGFNQSHIVMYKPGQCRSTKRRIQDTFYDLARNSRDKTSCSFDTLKTKKYFDGISNIALMTHLHCVAKLHHRKDSLPCVHGGLKWLNGEIIEQALDKCFSDGDSVSLLVPPWAIYQR